MTKKKPPPSFTVTAEDQFAAGLVRVWCVRSQKAGVPLERITAAYELAAEMDKWREENPT